MNKTKWEELEAKGWRQGSAAEFLGLSPEEEALIELKLQLSDAVKTFRTKSRLTQIQLAKRLGSSQSRVAKIEAGDPSVSLDLLARSLLALGASKQDIARAMAP